MLPPDYELNATNRTRKIICTNELWVPLARIGGCHLGGVSLGNFLKGGVGGVLCELGGD